MTELATISTVEGLDSLPAGSVILAAFPAGAAEKHPNGNSWWFAGSHVVYRSETVPLPAKLLYRPLDIERHGA